MGVVVVECAPGKEGVDFAEILLIGSMAIGGYPRFPL